MCGRYTLSKTGRLLLTNRFGFDEEFDDRRFPPQFNIAPTESAPVLFETDGHRHIEGMLFGLIPHWAKDAKIAAQCINARAESVHEKPAFRNSFRRKRCLVIADGYYEWKHEGKKKLPYRVTMKDNDLFAFAGLWDEWKRPDTGQEFKTFSIITTETNGLTREFHERMPVILPRESEALWLSSEESDPEKLLPLLKPFPADRMTLYPVSTAVNKATNKGSELIVPFEKNDLI
jgi:putative SOS response-associated peptidase YedK